MKTTSIFTLVFALFVLLAGCNPTPEPTATPTEESIGIANPASVFCEESGGRLEIRTILAGEISFEAGYCVFPDGSECEEWALFRNECTPASVFQPLSQTECANLQDTVAQTLGLEATEEITPFTDPLSGESGFGCQITVTGTGEDLANFVAVAENLKAALTAQGWTEDFQYLADSPMGTAAGLQHDNQLCLLTVEWTPSEDANCPNDQPISACELLPEQQLYTVALACAQEVR